MDKCFINFSNHSSKNWDKSQVEATKEYGEIVDIGFPQVDPNAGKKDINKLADEFVELIKKKNPAVVMCQGEFTLCFAVVSKLQKLGIKCVAACSDRKVVEKVLEDGSVEKTAIFEFVGFREY